MGFQWTVPPTQLIRSLQDYDRDVQDVILTLGQLWAAEVEQWMKVNAPWTDRTGHARHTLFATAKRDGSGIEAIIGGQAPYQVYLETSNGGYYAIIIPAFQIWPQELMRDIQAAIK